jgi:hypothetical protein
MREDEMRGGGREEERKKGARVSEISKMEREIR